MFVNGKEKFENVRKSVDYSGQKLVLPPPSVYHGTLIIQDGKDDEMACFRGEITREGTDATVSCQGARLGVYPTLHARFVQTVVKGAVGTREGQVGKQFLVDKLIAIGVVKQVTQQARGKLGVRTQAATVLYDTRGGGVHAQFVLDEIAQHV